MTTVESIIFSLMEDAKHPALKQIIGVVKAHNAVGSTLSVPGVAEAR